MEATISTDPAGNFSLLPIYYAEPGTTILSAQHNLPLEDIAQALSQRLMRDGRNGMVGDLDMGSYKVKNLAPGTAATDAATVGQGTPVGAILDYAGSTAPEGWLLCAGQAVSRTSYAALFAVIGTTYGAGNGSTTFNLPDCRGRVRAGKDDMNGSNANRLGAVFGAAARALGGALGAASHILTVAQMPSHNHGGATGADGNHNHGGSTGGAGGHNHTGTTSAAGQHSHAYVRSNTNEGSSSGAGKAGDNYTDNTGDAGVHTHSFSTNTVGNHNHSIANSGNHSHSISAQGGGDAHPNAQPTIVFNTIIKAMI